MSAFDPYTAAEPLSDGPVAFPTATRAPAAPAAPAVPPAPADAPAPPAPAQDAPAAAEFDPYAGTEAPPAPPRATRPASTRVVFKKKADREHRHPLKGECEVDGREVTYVVVRRITTGEMIDYLDALRAQPDGEILRFPIYFLPWGEPVDDDIWNGLDPDDTDELTEVARGFLPSRFLPTRSDSTRTEDPGSAPSGTGDTTGNTSG